MVFPWEPLSSDTGRVDSKNLTGDKSVASTPVKRSAFYPNEEGAMVDSKNPAGDKSIASTLALNWNGFSLNLGKRL